MVSPPEDTCMVFANSKTLCPQAFPLKTSINSPSGEISGRQGYVLLTNECRYLRVPCAVGPMRVTSAGGGGGGWSSASV